ncbi:hypothetical protein PIIN_08155 [Serendipita indica DSM 11827]|uniref:Uncharacterized protein n=1 Tax=Serendipita indica (strain DSM 11827) TaxID=1109443 RepID=G4TSA8_SERID|nr:hypothetical protein PIIN_08155 [Serendipita indica DSM 11827]
MSKQEILSWTQRVENDEEDDQLPVEFDWTRLEDDWSGFMLFAQQQLLNSSTKLRTGFINGRLIPLAARADFSMSQTMDMFKLVIVTLPRYIDAPSRLAALKMAETMVRRDELRGKPEGEADVSKMGVSEQIIGWLNVEATRMSKSSG